MSHLIHSCCNFKTQKHTYTCYDKKGTITNMHREVGLTIDCQNRINTQQITKAIYFPSLSLTKRNLFCQPTQPTNN